jgi:LPS O-antigen subunit length determinant protein (WzzB/FepE family)
MALQIDRVESEVEITKVAGASAPSSAGGAANAAGDDTLGALRGRNQLREQLRPIVLEILHDELDRMKRKVGAP